LSENEESHEFIRNSGVSFSLDTLDKPTSLSPKGDEELGTSLVKLDETADKDSDRGGSYNPQSIFNRINYLLEFNELKLEKRQEQLDKQALIVTLITSFYLNLARNEANIKFLLNLKLFKKLNDLM